MTQIAEATAAPTIAAPTVSTRRRRRGGLVSGVIGLVAGLTMMATAAPANAATLVPGQYNASLSRAWNWADCFIQVGPVVDYNSPWAAIAGATANCGSRHSFTTVSVSLKFNGATIPGSVRHYNYTNSFGTGNRIVTTPRYCGSGIWQESATVTISGLGTLNFSSGVAAQTTACRA